jgi:hypothetical protein
VLSGRDEERLGRVASETGAAEETIRFARIHARKLSALLGATRAMCRLKPSRTSWCAAFWTPSGRATATA